MQEIKFPVPNRSEYIPSPLEPDADGVLDIGYYKGTIIGGRPYVLECWQMDELVVATVFFRTKVLTLTAVKIWCCFWNWKILLNLPAQNACFSVRIPRMMQGCPCGRSILPCRMPRANMLRFYALYADIDETALEEE